MTDKPLLLDLFCCAGGASTGFARSGFRVIGVDVNPQPHYPYPFIQIDALYLMRQLLERGYYAVAPEQRTGKWDAPRVVRFCDIAAFAGSPPCQGFSKLSLTQPGTQEKYPNLIPKTRELFIATGKPYCIENVPEAPLNWPVTLCGSMFGKRLRLHREFETNFHVRPLSCKHNGLVLNPHSTAGRARMRAEFGPDANQAKIWRDEKGVPWMNWNESSEAIIPDYTEYIGGYMMQEVIARTELAA